MQGVSRLALALLGEEAMFDSIKMVRVPRAGKFVQWRFQALLNSGETSTCPLVDAFQVDCEEDTCFYVVKVRIPTF